MSFLKHPALVSGGLQTLSTFMSFFWSGCSELVTCTSITLQSKGREVTRVSRVHHTVTMWFAVFPSALQTHRMQIHQHLDTQALNEPFSLTHTQCEIESVECTKLCRHDTRATVEVGPVNGLGSKMAAAHCPRGPPLRDETKMAVKAGRQAAQQSHCVALTASGQVLSAWRPTGHLLLFPSFTVFVGFYPIL